MAGSVALELSEPELMKPGVHIVTHQDRLKALQKGTQRLAGRLVLVGIPGENTERQEGEIKNAQLGYIHEFGAPEVGIPARPFLIPGIQDAQAAITRHLQAAGKAVLTGQGNAAEAHLNAAGLAAVNSVRKRLTAGIPPPLVESTLRARARRKRGSGHRITKGAKAELAARAKGFPPSVEFAKPLIDTGQLLASITYVIRDSK